MRSKPYIYIDNSMLRAISISLSQAGRLSLESVSGRPKHVQRNNDSSPLSYLEASPFSVTSLLSPCEIEAVLQPTPIRKLCCRYSQRVHYAVEPIGSCYKLLLILLLLLLCRLFTEEHSSNKRTVKPSRNIRRIYSYKKK